VYGIEGAKGAVDEARAAQDRMQRKDSLMMKGVAADSILYRFHDDRQYILYYYVRRFASCTYTPYTILEVPESKRRGPKWWFFISIHEVVVSRNHEIG
jgi:hypothetical protein